jgi:DNA polymerase-3 subunit beta
MRISVEKLKTAWRQVVSVCPSRSPKEIFQYVRLDLSDDGFSMHATDGEVYVQVGTCDEPTFSRLLPAKAFTRLLDACGHDEIGFAESLIKCGSDVWELQSPDVEDWLFCGIKDTGRTYEVDCDSLKEAIAISVLSVDTESTRYALGGVLLEFMDADTLALIATDGRRLSITEIDCDCEGEPDNDVKPIVPLKTLKTLLGLCGTEGMLTFSYGTSGGIVLHTSNATIHSPLVSGRFPEWSRVVPTEKQASFSITAGAISGVLKSASITTSEESRGLHVTLSEDGITCTSQAADVGRSRVSRQMLFESDAEMTINPDYLLPVLHKLGDDCELTLDFIKSDSPLVFSHDGGFRYVLMPLAQ